MWLYFLKDKSETFATFKCFKKLVENEINLSVCCLRTDRGGEFTSHEFNEFCRKEGIKRQLTAAYTPQQNGVAKCRNRTIMNMVRSILSDKGIPKNFWPEATNWSRYVLNRSPTNVVQGVTPEEKWSGFKPTVDHFKNFSCIGYVHVPDAKRIKLDAKSQKCVFFGVSEESKAYRMYNPITKKLIISRDVIFDEEANWDWESNVDTPDVLVQEEEEKECEQLAPENDETVLEEENGSAGIVRTSSSSPLSSTSSSPLSSTRIEERNRLPPFWMRSGDYVSGEGLSKSEDEVRNMAVFINNEDPVDFDEAVRHSKWRNAMKAEIDAIERNQTWELTNLPTGMKKIGVKWVFKTKLNEKGEVDKCKARLVAKGYAQQFGVDYNEVYAPVAKWATI